VLHFFVANIKVIFGETPSLCTTYFCQSNALSEVLNTTQYLILAIDKNAFIWNIAGQKHPVMMNLIHLRKSKQNVSK